MNKYTKVLFYNYAQHTESKELDEAEEYLDKAVAVYELIKRLVADNTNFINTNFTEEKLYIDGCVTYKDDEEKQLIQEIFKENSVDECMTSNIYFKDVINDNIDVYESEWLKQCIENWKESKYPLYTADYTPVSVEFVKDELKNDCAQEDYLTKFYEEYDNKTV